MTVKFRFDNSYSRLPETFYHRVKPSGFDNPHWVSWNAAAAELLDIDEDAKRSGDLLKIFSGTHIAEGSEPLAAVYAGHQFGVFVPRLGDGRAILLGEIRNCKGEKWDVQLKGAGQTRYSRFADGRAVLRSTVREYLCSEAMHGLGIPTTRALCIIGSDEAVFRERRETGAMLVRLAPSHVRFGSFEYFYYSKQHEDLKTLGDYVIAQQFPDFAEKDDRYQLLFDTAVGSTADLIAQWQAVGFAHGVMNSDNMSILGLTIDYGPFGFVEEFNPGYICNHSDETGRYAFARQPSVGLFNLNCLANAFLPLIDIEELKAILVSYEKRFIDKFYALMEAKLGIPLADEEARHFCDRSLELLYKNQVDYTGFFRGLAAVGAHDKVSPIDRLFTDQEGFYNWLRDYQARCLASGKSDVDRRAAMERVNPKYILRNYLAQTAIEKAEQGDFSEIAKLLQILRDPFSEQPENDVYAEPSPEWGKHLEISCSS